MANSADGYIRIDSELDNSGFEKGSDKLLSALQSLQKSVDAIGDTLSNGLDSVIKSLQALSSQATDTNQQVTQSAQQATTANQDVAQAAQQAAQATAQSGQAAAQAGQQVQQTAQAAAQATQAMAAAPKNLTTEYNSIGQSAASLHDQIMRLSTAAEIGFKNDGQILRFRDNVEIVTRKTQELRDRLNALANTRIPTEDYAFLQSEVDKTDKTLQKLLDRQQKMDDTGVKRNSATYKRLLYDIDNARKALSSMRAEMADMETNGEAFTLGSNTAEYQNMSGVLSQLENELSSVQEKSGVAQLALSSLGGSHPILATLATAAQKAGSALLTMAKAVGKAAIHAFARVVKSLGAGLRNVASSAKRAISGLLGFNKTAKAGINPINGLIRGLTSFKTMLISRIKSTFISQISKSLQEGIQQFALYSSEFNTAMSNIKNTGSQIGAQVAALVANIITVIEPVLTRILSLINSVITAISALFAKLTGKSTVAVAAKGTGSYADSLKDAAGSAKKAAKEQKKFNAELYGWDELTRQNKNEDTDTDSGAGASGPSWTEVPVDDILKDWEDIDWFQLGYDWAEKLANALDAIPWDKIQAAAYRIGQHFAELLNGVFANLHLADSLGKTIAEALNTGLSFALGFLETFDFSQFGVWMGTLWNAFVNAFDFDKLASVIELGGNGIIAAFTSFFQTIASTCETLGGGLAKIFNAIFVGIDFSAAANAILLGIHDLNLALKGFNDGVDWTGAAQNIRDSLNTLIRGMVIDENGDLTNVWAENGREIGRLINNFWTTANEVISGLDFVTLGENLALWLNNVVAQINPEKIGGTLGGIIRGAIDMAFAFKESINTDELAEKIKAAAQSCVDKMNEVDPSTGLNGWQKLGSTIAGLANGIVIAFESLPWGQIAAGVGQAISTGLSEAKPEVKLALGVLTIVSIGKAIIGSAVGQGIGKALGENIVKNLGASWPSLGGSIAGALSSLGSSIKAFATTDIFAAGAGSIGAAILAGLFIGSEIGKLIDHHIIAPIIEALGGDEVTAELYRNFHWFGEGGFFDQMWSDNSTFLENVQTWGDALVMMFSDFGKFISDTWNTCWTGVNDFVGPKVEAIKTTVSEGWNHLKTNTATAMSDIKGGIVEKWNNIRSTVSTSATTARTNATNAWNALRTNTSTAYNSVKSTIQTKFNSARTAVSTAVNTMKTSAVAGWNVMVSNASAKFQNIYNTCKSKMSSVTSHLKGIQWGTTGTNLVNGLLNGLKSAWNNVTSWISSATSALTSKVKSILGIASPSKEWAKIGVFLDQGLTEGLQTGERSLLDSASALANNLTDRMTDANGAMRFTDDADIARLDIVTSKLSGIAAIIDHISAALASMGGLQIPQIALGTVAPYRTRAAAVGGGGYDADSTADSYTAEAVQLLRNIRDYLVSGGSNQGNNDIKVIIDGREVFNAVVNENNRAITKSGGVSPLRV